MPAPANLLPYWVSTNLQNFGPVSGPFVTLVGGVAGLTTAVANDITATAATAAGVNARLLGWYDAQTQPAATTAAVQNFTNGISNYVYDVWNSGINWFILKPAYGGFDAITQAILPSIGDPTDPNAPLYSDDMYAGAVMLLLTGPPFTLYKAANTLILMATGRTADALAALQDLTADSAAAGSVMTALSDLVSLPEAAWNTETQQLQNLFNNSAITKILSGDVFPLNMLNAASFAVSGVDPIMVKKGADATFTFTGNGFLPSDVITCNHVAYPVNFVSAQELSITVASADPLLATPGVKSLHINHQGKDSVAGSITVLSPTLFEDLANMSDPLYFDVWHSVAVGDALNSLIPGAATIVDKTLQTLDTLGQGVLAAESLGHTALQATGATVAAVAHRAATDVTAVGTGASDFLTELLSLSASVLVIPPALGGNHELGFALGQGLNGYALNTPIVNGDDGVMAMFFCAGDRDRNKVVTAINTVANLLHISSWPTLA